MNMRRHFHRHGGVASFIAVAALGLVATAALAMVTMLRLDHRRTQASDVDAQLRQLLIAGAAEAERQLETQTPPDLNGDLALPAELADAGASVSWQPTDEDVSPTTSGEMRLTVIAAFGEDSAYQRLSFVVDANAGGYRLVDASYHP